MGHYQSPVFETTEFTDEELIITNPSEDEGLDHYNIVVRWKINITFDNVGIWSMSPEITWIQVHARFEPCEQPDDPQLHIEGSDTNINFTPETKGWDVKINVEDNRPEYRCTAAYIDVDDMVAEIHFG